MDGVYRKGDARNSLPIGHLTTKNEYYVGYGVVDLDLSCSLALDSFVRIGVGSGGTGFGFGLRYRGGFVCEDRSGILCFGPHTVPVPAIVPHFWYPLYPIVPHCTPKKP